MTAQPFRGGTLPSDLSKYVYGTTRLGDDSIPRDSRVALARAAMNAGVWFHTSDQYGDALDVLREAFDQDRTSVPRLIMKIGNDSIDEIEGSIRRQTERLGVERLDVGQLCFGEMLRRELANGGKLYEDLRRLKETGLVEHYMLEVFPWTSKEPFDALRVGRLDGLVGACIMYLNPLQRFASNELWHLLLEREVPIVAMRTVAGGDVVRLRDVPGAAWKPYLQQRATQVAPVFERSGVAHWSEFCVRFAHSVPHVQATVGATSVETRLNEFVCLTEGEIEPLDSSVMSELFDLQRRWADEVDAVAEPWSM